MITVTRPWLPDRERLDSYIDQVYKSGHLTNNGPLVRLLEERLQTYLGVKHLILVSNGTLALQIAYRALGVTGEVITTPFSFIATSSSLAWQNCKPVFADIDPLTLNIDVDNVTSKITSKTSALVPVHVFGNPCNVERLNEIASKHNLKIVYDASHAFGVNYHGESILSQGDISTISFHATKLFHTIEGGALVTNDSSLAKKIRLMIKCGIVDEENIALCGINAKMHELSAAMGLSVLDDIDTIKKNRAQIWQQYKIHLSDYLKFQKWNENATNNCAYVPVLFSNEQELLKVKNTLNNFDIFPRRYFYPSLDQINFLLNNNKCLVADDVSKRILCLPIYPNLKKQQQRQVIELIKNVLKLV
ncbi:DegT/DnrJ/EryC1/StrS family aminotransferase [Alteromonas sp. M12]|uniref:DegT/DnrJ/EryC1/StrS family aminotransferase n=1 Tax=Alteromonas sp. M12 TaxID=3135644 RepID=UPI00319E718D